MKCQLEPKPQVTIAAPAPLKQIITSAPAARLRLHIPHWNIIDSYNNNNFRIDETNDECMRVHCDARGLTDNT